MEPCRRVCRSSVKSLALEFLLSAEQERSGASCLAVSTLEGLSVSGVGDLEPAVAAAVSALRMEGVLGHPLLASLSDRAFAMSVVELSDGQRVLVTKVDGGPVSRELEQAVVRILS
jgi:hypothetical protein